MIVSFRDSWLQAWFVDSVRSKQVPASIEKSLFRKLQMIDDATEDKDLRSPPGNHFEKLQGRLARFHSIRVNERWRILFEWDPAEGEARLLHLDDHSYRG